MADMPEVLPVIIYAVSPNGFIHQLKIDLQPGQKLLTALPQVERALLENGWRPTSAPAVALASAENAVALDTTQRSTAEFTVDELLISIQDGKTYYKVKGGRYQKFGVTIWPEVLKAAAIDPQKLDPYSGNQMNGYRAVAQLKPDGNPLKVVKLIPPTHSASA